MKFENSDNRYLILVEEPHFSLPVNTCTDNVIANGELHENCTDKSVGTECTFSCDNGYSRSTPLVVCTANSRWRPAEACVGEKHAEL